MYSYFYTFSSPGLHLRWVLRWGDWWRHRRGCLEFQGRIPQLDGWVLFMFMASYAYLHLVRTRILLFASAWCNGECWSMCSLVELYLDLDYWSSPYISISCVLDGHVLMYDWMVPRVHTYLCTLCGLLTGTSSHTWTCNFPVWTRACAVPRLPMCFGLLWGFATLRSDLASTCGLHRLVV